MKYLIIFSNLLIVRNGFSPKGSSDHEENVYSRTLAFGKQQDSAGESSPGRAYVPAGNLEPVKESWSVKKIKNQKHMRSKSSLNTMSRSRDKNYQIIYKAQRNSARDIEPEDWLLKKRNKRLEKGGEYLYKPNLPKQLSGKDKLNSFREIKEKVNEVERKANQIETQALDNYTSNNIIRDNAKVGTMYVDAIQAKGKQHFSSVVTISSPIHLLLLIYTVSNLCVAQIIMSMSGNQGMR